MNTNSDLRSNAHIAVIGGGVAGSAAALHFSEQGFQVTLIEKGDDLISGPPICHLHAGGNLYRDISTEQCLELLRQSIDSVRLFPHTINRRPTVIAVPHSDGGDPEALLPRLKQIQQCYTELVKENGVNEVLGKPSDYFRLYDQQQLEQLAQREQPLEPVTMDDWVIPFAQHSDLQQLKYPVVVVQEYGWSVFRLAATAKLSLANFPDTDIRCQTALIDVQQTQNGYQLLLKAHDQTQQLHVDYVVNACGFETGKIDDTLGLARERLVEFKAAYVTAWPECRQHWPEVIFHGPRNTPKGMAQFTPYGDGIFQLHGMTPNITLFKDGLAKSDHHSAQPNLPQAHVNKIRHGWPQEVLSARTEAAIEHLAQFIPNYQSARPAGKALFGAQQVPGNDISLRAADVSFEGERYARIEIVKASSTLQAAQKILQQWFGIEPSSDVEHNHPVTLQSNAQQVEACAMKLAQLRGYPVALAKISGQDVFTSAQKATTHDNTEYSDPTSSPIYLATA